MNASPDLLLYDHYAFYGGGFFNAECGIRNCGVGISNS